MATTIVAYILHAIGFTPDIRVQQPWPTPICLGGYISTLSWRGAVTAVICAVVAFLVWHPFMKRFDLKTYKKEEEAKQ
ncbi:hypothetical protein [uncultured Lactobacillus sp.]|uniref:hypothetical protein n=1 Tax=uncultured Lactobacillus sp. TaxID=153152 RepID=UPI00260D4573|nr:hypothetical protein [uncultured Lactobacillus sp.]